MDTHLLQTGNVASDVLHSDRVLHGQPVALALYPGPVDDYSSVGSEACNRVKRKFHLSHTLPAPTEDSTHHIGREQLAFGGLQNLSAYTSPQIVLSSQEGWRATNASQTTPSALIS